MASFAFVEHCVKNELVEARLEGDGDWMGEKMEEAVSVDESILEFY